MESNLATDPSGIELNLGDRVLGKKEKNNFIVSLQAKGATAGLNLQNCVSRPRMGTEDF